MHELPLLIDITAAMIAAFIGGFLARKVGMPTIVGYMIGGVVIGPFTPGYVSEIENISQLAELGVIFLMFGVGLHFSLKDLWNVRAIAIPGAIGQMATSTIFGVILSQVWGWSLQAGILLGLAISIASTVVLLRGLIDNGLLNTSHGQAAIGWLVLEDIATVLILVLLPAFKPESNQTNWIDISLVLIKAIFFIGLLLLIGKRFIPWLLMKIAHTRSHELFILSILAISLGTAITASVLFGISLALGAFIAGVLVNESPLSHKVGADLVPFREVFAVLFFVSIGMLVNPMYLWNNLLILLALFVLIVIGKPLITLLLGFIFRWPIKTSLVVAVGLSQIGEFSFILGQAGISLGIISRDQYSLILAGAILTITINPLLFRLIEPLEKAFEKNPIFSRLWLKKTGTTYPSDDNLKNHVVIIGYGRVGRHIVDILENIGIPYLVVDADSNRMAELSALGKPVLYGDAANSEVLHHTKLQNARALVVARPDESGSEIIVAAARDLAPTLPIIARATTTEGVKRLSALGAQHVVHPELEGGLEIVQFTLSQLGFPPYEIFRYREAVRQDNYNLEVNTENEHRLLAELIQVADNAEVFWKLLPAESLLVGHSIQEADLRARTGASIIAINRGRQLIANPKSQTVFEAGDRIGLIGDPVQIRAVEEILKKID